MQMVPIFDGSARQLSSWGMRYEFRQQRSRADGAYLDAWKEAVGEEDLKTTAGSFVGELKEIYDGPITAHNDEYS